MATRRKKTAPAEPVARLKMRRYGANGHGYTLDGEKVPGATTILNALPKELKQWAADCAANYAVEHWDQLGEESLTKRLDKIRFAYKDVVSAAAVRGTRIHALGEQLQAGAVDVPEELRGPVEAYARFLDLWQITPIATETPLCHTGQLYAGTADLWAEVGVRDGARALIDLKTGKSVYESTVLQLAAYRYADVWQPNGPASEESLPAVDQVWVAHILPDDVRMLPIECGPEQWRQFLYVKQTWLWLQAHGFRGEEPLIGEAETPDGRAA